MTQYEDELQRYKRKYEEEVEIVNRCWTALGISSYSGANGLSIYEHIAALKAKVDSQLYVGPICTTELTEAELLNLKPGPIQVVYPLDEEWNAAIEECAKLLGREDVENDPDDLYTGRAHRVAAVRSLTRRISGPTTKGD